MSPADRDRAFALAGKWFADHADKIRGGSKLQGAHTATTVRLDGGGEPIITDGPFVEGKEVVSGYCRNRGRRPGRSAAHGARPGPVAPSWRSDPSKCESGRPPDQTRRSSGRRGRARRRGSRARRPARRRADAGDRRLRHRRRPRPRRRRDRDAAMAHRRDPRPSRRLAVHRRPQPRARRAPPREQLPRQAGPTALAARIGHRTTGCG